MQIQKVGPPLNKKGTKSIQGGDLAATTGTPFEKPQSSLLLMQQASSWRSNVKGGDKVRRVGGAEALRFLRKRVGKIIQEIVKKEERNLNIPNKTKPSVQRGGLKELRATFVQIPLHMHSGGVHIES